jgi:hypothetical protein
VSAFSSDVHYRRLPRSARHLARAMLRRGGAYHRALPLRAAGNALGYAVEVEHSPAARMPAEPGDAPGQRVRIGRETRDLLKRLLASRNRLHQVALVREIRDQIARRIKLHNRRSRQMAAARAGARSTGRMAVAWASAGRTRVLQPPRARTRQVPAAESSDRAARSRRRAERWGARPRRRSRA